VTTSSIILPMTRRELLAVRTWYLLIRMILPPGEYTMIVTRDTIRIQRPPTDEQVGT
jgi:hypothetical protein